LASDIEEIQRMFAAHRSGPAIPEGEVSLAPQLASGNFSALSHFCEEQPHAK
jgi:hypothetical protein